MTRELMASIIQGALTEIGDHATDEGQVLTIARQRLEGMRQYIIALPSGQREAAQENYDVTARWLQMREQGYRIRSGKY